MGIEVRRLGIADAALAADLLALSGRAGSGLAGWLADPAHVLVGATIEGEPAGVGMGYVLPRPDARPPMLLLYSLDVGEPYRRRGVATAILACFRDLAGGGRTWLLTNASNGAAMALYRSAGGQRWHADDVLWVWPGHGDVPPGLT